MLEDAGGEGCGLAELNIYSLLKSTGGWRVVDVGDPSVWGGLSANMQTTVPFPRVQWLTLLLLRHLIAERCCRGQNQSTACFDCWPKCAHRGIFDWFLLSFWPSWIIPDNAFYQSKTVDSFWPVHARTARKNGMRVYTLSDRRSKKNCVYTRPPKRRG